MIYVSVDIETTSLDPKRGQILELAMVIEDTSNPVPLVEELPHFHELVPVGQGLQGDIFALGLNADLIAEILKMQKVKWEAPHVVFNRALDWLNSKLDPSRKQFSRLTMAGKNAAGFDLPWLYEHASQLASRFHHRVLDPGSVFVDWTKDQLPSLADLVPAATKHRALDDARAVVLALRRAYA